MVDIATLLMLDGKPNNKSTVVWYNYYLINHIIR